jgi:anti-sigma B factor antagonist
LVFFTDGAMDRCYDSGTRRLEEHLAAVAANETRMRRNWPITREQRGDSPSGSLGGRRGAADLEGGDMSLLDVTSEANSDGTVLVKMAGDLDLGSADVLQQALLAAEKSHPSTLYLDLSGLGFMDSTGLRLILQANERAKRALSRLALIAGRESVQRVFRVTGMQEHLEFVDRAPGETEGR